jgi:hypothetical protein
MIYEPIEKSWWEENKPEFVDDFMSLPRNSRILVIFMSVVLIGGGTAGCIIAAGGFSVPITGNYCVSVRPKSCYGIGNRNQSPISVSMSEPIFFRGQNFMLILILHGMGLLFGL